MAAAPHAPQGDDAGDGAAEPQVPVEDEEVEDPEEVIHFVSSDEEDTPAMNTRGRKRKSINSRTYLKLFKK